MAEMMDGWANDGAEERMDGGGWKAGRQKIRTAETEGVRHIGRMNYTMLYMI